MRKVAAPARSMRKSARQARAQDTVKTSVLAAARILKTDGVRSLTTNHIARTAGVSVWSLYQYFPNKEAILVAHIREHLPRDDDHFGHVVLAQQDNHRAGIRAIT